MSPNNKEYKKAYNKAYYQSHKEESKVRNKAWTEANREEWNAHRRSDVNSLGKTKNSIRGKSWCILKRMKLHIPGYEIHHCFGYEDASKFIYISKSLHLKLHQYLRDNNIDADTNHWHAIRDIINNTDEFTYVKC